jgi:hypothetical protein
MEEDKELPPPELPPGGNNEPPAPPAKEGDNDSELTELYELIDARDAEISALRAELEAATARIGQLETGHAEHTSAFNAYREHTHQEYISPEERNIWFRHIGPKG